MKNAVISSEESESRNTNILKRQQSKFDRLCQQKRGVYSNPRGGHPKNDHPHSGRIPNVSTIMTTPHTDKWVKNLSRAPLTKVQVSLLARGPNFAIAPRPWTHKEYITTTVDQACLSLEPYKTEELRAEIRGLSNIHTPQRQTSPKKRPRDWMN